jgi:hypothetical protein
VAQGKDLEMTSPALQRYVIAWAEREVAIASVKRAEKDMFNEERAAKQAIDGGISEVTLLTGECFEVFNSPRFGISIRRKVGS